MSPNAEDQIRGFLHAVTGSPELQAKVLSIGVDNVEDMIALAKENGFEASVEDLRADVRETLFWLSRPRPTRWFGKGQRWAAPYDGWGTLNGCGLLP